MAGAAGDFHLERRTATEMGLKTTKTNDERFDIDKASVAAAKYLKKIDLGFRKKTSLKEGISTIPVDDPIERKNFTLAAYNAGQARIAKAQAIAAKNGKDPTKWSDVKEYLTQAGAIPSKAKEIQDYVDKVLEYEAAFSRISKADKGPEAGHWITKNHRHIFIEDKGA